MASKREMERLGALVEKARQEVFRLKLIKDYCDRHDYDGTDEFGFQYDYRCVGRKIELAVLELNRVGANWLRAESEDRSIFDKISDAFFSVVDKAIGHFEYDYGGDAETAESLARIGIEDLKRIRAESNFVGSHNDQ